MKVDQAIEILAASEPGLGKDIAAVHLRFLTLPGDNTFFLRRRAVS